MTLIASVLAGSLTGYFAGSGRRGHRIFLSVWLATFAVQTALLLLATDDVRNDQTGEWDLAYLPISLGILAAGALILHGTAALSRRRKARSSTTSS